MIWKFDSFTFDGRVLYQNGELIDLTPQEYQLLQILVMQASRKLQVVPTQDQIRLEMANYLWPERPPGKRLDSVESKNLSKVISKLSGKLRLYSNKKLIKQSRLIVVLETVESSNIPSTDVSDHLNATESRDETRNLMGVSRRFSPYPGPQEFRPRMAGQFYGRNTECEALIDCIRKHRVIVVNGPSGAGKSSLLNVLVQERLKEDFEVLAGARVGGALPDIDKAIEIHNIFTLAAITSLDLISNPTSTLGDCLASSHRKPGARDRVLILDQFEELFTLHPERHKDRAGFLQDLADALTRDSSLRVILAIRNEYLADLDLLCDRVFKDLPIERFRLLPMDLTDIAEAITQPIKDYARFAKGVVNEIISQLNIIKVRGSDGVVVEAHGEFIELVHLQIVCQRLWERLHEGTTEIEMKHLQEAAGESTFREFVVNALDEFYEDVVRKVADSEVTEANGGYTEESIFFGCMQFISPDQTRTTIPVVDQRVGRLPYWIVRQLAENHLLTELGGRTWYQLAHDRLVDAISRRKDKKVDALLYAADLLEKVLRKALAKNGHSLKDYFESHPEIVTECHQFLVEEGIYKNEAEFIFRSSLVASLQEAREWSKTLAQKHPQLRIDVLREALKSDRQEVRRNASILLGADPVNDLLPELVRLAIDDDDAEVQEAAAESLAGLDTTKLDPEITKTLFDGVISKLQDPESQSRAEAALSRISIGAYRLRNGPIVKACFRNVSRMRRVRIRARAVRLQLWEALPILLCIVIPAGAFAAFSAAFYKMLPSLFGWALAQKEANAGPGFYQGFSAGVIWAGLIVLGLTVYYIISAREHHSNSNRSLLQATVTGTASGLLGSLIIILVIGAVFDQKVLENIGWILPGRARFSRDFLKDLFWTTRFAWPYLITGGGLGMGMAITIHRLRTDSEWNDFKKRQPALTTFKQTHEAIRGIMEILNKPKNFWPLPTLLLLAGLAAFFVPAVQPRQAVNFNEVKVPCEIQGVVNIRAGRIGLLQGLIGDVTTQAVGAYFGIVGMGLGIVMVKGGLNLRARPNI
jgi:HEAT repeats